MPSWKTSSCVAAHPHPHSHLFWANFSSQLYQYRNSISTVATPLASDSPRWPVASLWWRLGDSAAGQVWYTLPGIALKPLGCEALLCLQVVDTFLPHWLWAGLRDSLWLVERGRSSWGEGLNVFAWFLLSLSAPPPALRTACPRFPGSFWSQNEGCVGSILAPVCNFCSVIPHTWALIVTHHQNAFTLFFPLGHRVFSRIWPIQLLHGLTYICSLSRKVRS